MNPTHAIGAVFLALAVAAGGWLGMAPRVLEQVQRPLGDTIRWVVGAQPELSPRVQVLLIDGATRDQVDGDDLPLYEWRNLFTTLGEAHAILTDKDFAAPLGRDEADRFEQTVGSLPVQRLSRVWVSRRGQLPKLDLSHPDFQRNHWEGSPKFGDLIKGKSELEPSGIHPSIRNAFSHLGHALLENPFQFRPLVSMDSSHVIAALPLFLVDKIQLNGTRLKLDSRRTLPAFQNVPISLVSMKSLEAQTQSLTRHLIPLREGRPGPVVGKKDVFVIMEAPRHIGEEASLTARHRALASLVHSAITGQWISPFGNPATMTAVSALAALPLMLVRTPGLLVALGSGLTMGIGLILFLLFSVEIPWLNVLVGFGGVGGCIAMIRRYGDQQRAAQIRGALEGYVEDAELERLTRRPEGLETIPKQHVATVMFVELVGFSNEIQRNTPWDAFEQLDALIDSTTQLVHQHRGIVGKILGDSMLCYFGHHYDGNHDPQDHADAALNCALELQRQNLDRNFDASKKGEPIYPLRIGINTGTVYVGNTGRGNRVEFSLLGETVGIAKLLESACDDYCVMLGASTRDMLRGTFSLRERKIEQVRHREMVDAFEADPLETDPARKSVAVKLHRESLGLQRTETRWPVPDPSSIQIQIGEETAKLVNFSTSGFAMEMDTYLGNGTSVKLRLSSLDGALDGVLRKDGLSYLTGVIRWGRHTNGGKYLHGLEIEALDQRQKLMLINHLRRALMPSDKATPLSQPLPLPKKVG